MLLTVVITVLSCQKSDTLPEESNIDLGVIKEFENSDISSKRLLFNILKPAERLHIWEKAFETLQKGPELAENQKILIKEIQQKLSVELYDEKQLQLREDFLVNFMPNWKSRAKKSFSESELRVLLMLPLKYSNGTVSLKSTEYSKNTKIKSLNCDCHGGNPYDCNSTNGVLRCASGGGCSDSSWGCGDWWLQSCNYVCFRNGVPDQNYP